MKQFIGALFVMTATIAYAQETTAPAPPPPYCKAVCYTYEQLVAAERAEAAKSGCPNYVSPTENPVVAKIRLAYDLKGTDNLDGPIDDELRLLINGVEKWKQVYKANPPDGAEASFRKDQLLPGCNSVTVEYADSGGNAHFLARVGGRAFCGIWDYCLAYKEGYSFGTGIVWKIVGSPGRRGPVVHGNIWKSRYEDPRAETGCICRDPSFTVMSLYQAPLQ
ncbi:MAG TPA: hypothetical protein VJ276_18915 [Thermoanaerobaculia bacterium]|nr:hypothetical protein [Thermoanaerobaculia bacterium]